MVSQMKLSAKIFSGFAAVLVLTAIVAAAGYISLHMVSANVARLDVLRELNERTLQARRAEKNYLIRRDPQYIDGTHKEVAALRTAVDAAENEADDAFSRVLREIVEHANGYETAFDTYVAFLNGREKAEEDFRNNGRAMLDEIDALQREVLEQHQAPSAVLDGTVPPALPLGTLTALRQVHAMTAQFRAATDHGLQFVRSGATADFETALKACDECKAALTAYASETAGPMTGRSKRLEAQVEAYRASLNDLTQRGAALEKTDAEMVAAARAVHKLVEDASAEEHQTMARVKLYANAANAGASFFGLVAVLTFSILLTRAITIPLNRIITTLSSGAEQVNDASAQLSNSSMQMSEGATEQASSLEEISASLEEMASMTNQNADSARQADTMTSGVKRAAQQGCGAMTRMADAIDKIKGSSDETAKIIRTIDEIAFQTNLLALNAAVEAARAGEAGKGFAVVAEEVRNLAQRSAAAAKNTSALIEEAAKNAENGVRVSGEVAKVLEEIGSSVDTVTHLVAGVSAATGEQAQGIGQLNTAVSQLDRVTQANAAISEEAASAAEELSAQAASLNELVGQLKAIVGGSRLSGQAAILALPASAKPRLASSALRIAQ